MEKKKGKHIVVKTYLSFDERKIIIQVTTPNRLIEKSYPNSSTGQGMAKKFVSNFKSLKDINNYLNITKEIK